MNDSRKGRRVLCFLRELSSPVGRDDHYRPFLGDGFLNQALDETEKRRVCRCKLRIIDKYDPSSFGECSILRVENPFKVFKCSIGATQRLFESSVCLAAANAV